MLAFTQHTYFIENIHSLWAPVIHDLPAKAQDGNTTAVDPLPLPAVHATALANHAFAP
jgi:hypothetical protein